MNEINMKHLLTLSCLLLFMIQTKAQVNLVPNPSFESSACCPQGFVYPWLFDGWDLNYNTADYFHSTDTSNSQGVPTNGFGNQCALTGNSYVGLASYSIQILTDSTSLNNREYIGGFLSQPLIVGTKYYVSFKVSMADYYSHCASNKLGIKFFTQDLTNGNGYTFILNLPPPFVNNSSSVYTNDIITDSIGWQSIRGSFIADSTYSTFLIGNFFEIGNVDTLMFSSAYPTCLSYYYIDDVCISADSAHCEDLKKQLISISADSNIINQNSCVNFNLQTDINYNSYEWHFNGGFPSTSNQVNPANICYSDIGIYDVVFIGFKNGGCADTLTLSDYIQVDTVTATSNYYLENKIPNINLKDNVLHFININEHINFTIYDVNGKIIRQGQVSSKNSIDCNNLNAGTYILSINQSKYNPFKFTIFPESN